MGQIDPPAPPDAARVLTAEGRVSVLRDGYPWVLTLGAAVKAKEVVVTGPDGHATFQVLSDGSTFEVFPDSQVTFRANPGSLKDLLDLYIGRIKVHIQKLGGLPNPNRVQTPTAIISVRGTTFDVAVEDDGYTTFVMVEEGQVAVRHALLPSDEPKLLNPGESLRVYRNEPIAHSIDKGAILQQVLRAATQAYYTMVYRMPKVGGGLPTGGGGAIGVGDTKGTPPPPPPPPPAPSGP